MSIVVLISVIGLLSVVVAVPLSVADVLFKPPDKGGDRLVANLAAPVRAPVYRDTAAPAASLAPATAPTGVGYLDEPDAASGRAPAAPHAPRSEEHTSELQSHSFTSYP